MHSGRANSSAAAAPPGSAPPPDAAPAGPSGGPFSTHSLRDATVASSIALSAAFVTTTLSDAGFGARGSGLAAAARSASYSDSERYGTPSRSHALKSKWLARWKETVLEYIVSRRFALASGHIMNEKGVATYASVSLSRRNVQNPTWHSVNSLTTRHIFAYRPSAVSSNAGDEPSSMMPVISQSKATNSHVSTASSKAAASSSKLSRTPMAAATCASDSSLALISARRRVAPPSPTEASNMHSPDHVAGCMFLNLAAGW